ncbi:heavy metal translocating P-type ATPase [Gorillibacterium massiliense]|uniref:heavy metal translocating P-type ATPase n=1 Tax=Gorillibacterium massiliense TaxID=1280390 RepID=UPI0004BB4EE4|nr:heavy metal translocating P-type ATPase [Gorillibacterium massiliense]
MSVPQSVKKEYLLEGLDCANCAMKIEQGVKKIPGVSECSVNFMTKTLMVKTEDPTADAVFSEAKKKVKALESHIRVEEIIPRGARSSHSEPGEAGSHHSDHHEHEHSQEHDHGQQGHSHEHGGEGGGLRVNLIRLVASTGLTAAAMFAGFSLWIELGIFVIAYLFAGGDILLRAAKNIRHGQIFDENFLMVVATVGALAVGQYPEAVAVMLFYQVGEMFQDMAVNRSRRSIKSLLNIRPDYANLKIGDETKKVSPEAVQVGDVILVKPGEKVPLDGIVLSGSSQVDTSALTGESMPREVEAGGEVLGGFVNKNGLLTVQVSKPFGESTVAKILDLVQNASSKKAQTENFITRFARYYTPSVVIAAVLLAVIPPLVVPDAAFSDWVYRALTFLVISCPCALVISIPLGFFGGIGAASRAGILVKGSNYLEALNDVKYVVFDKTGTLTKGTFRVTAVHPASDFTREDLMRYAAHAEFHSSHPIAESIRAAYNGEWKVGDLTDYDEQFGYGIQVSFEGKKVLAGNSRLMQREGIHCVESEAVGTVVYLAVDGTFAGSIDISDEIKEDSVEAIRKLKRLGIKKTIMLTGDAAKVGNAVGAELGMDEVHAELLPEGKVERIEEWDRKKSRKEKIAFVGDGINDTPVLARADIGIAMGGLGSDAAIEAADIVIMTDEPSRLPTAIQIAKRTRRIVWQNIIFALGVKGFFLLLSALGFATMWEAVFSDVGVTVLAVLNAMRILRRNE